MTRNAGAFRIQGVYSSRIDARATDIDEAACLGAERKFAFRHKRTKETVSLLLEHGSLLVMKGTTQTHWLHRLPPTKKVHIARVNLTFRTMIV